MPNFSSWRAFHEFARIVRESRRFGYSPACVDFLSAVKASARDRLIRLRKGHPLWRAQRGHDQGTELAFAGEDGTENVFVDIEVPFDVERMSPDPAHVTEGRLNPRGIAFLYLAKDTKTAIAEVRPWVGVTVSVGVFEVLRDCTLVNCSEPGGRGLYLRISAEGVFVPPSPAEWDTLVWEAISYAFAHPTDPQDTSLTYAPTQILAEVLREEGYDGILYQSALHADGMNVALFDPSSARLFACDLHEIMRVEFRSRSTGRHYARDRETSMPPPTTAASSSNE
jgi:hypothetical protein